MNKLPNWLQKIGLLLVLLAVPLVHAEAAASVTLSPTQETVTQNNMFTLTLSINTDSNAVTGSDVTLQYAPADLQFVSATNGNFFPNMIPANDATAGQLVLHGYVTSSGDARTGSGSIATIVFKALKSSGSSTISFICTSGGHDTNVVATNGQNVINCGLTNYVGVVYGAPSPTDTPTPTPTPGPGTPTPTPGQRGSPACTSLTSNISSAVTMPVPVTFTCSGIYSSGYIGAAYFDFGDGTHDTVAKNAGSPASLSTTHTYTSTGSFSASCKVQNNDQAWSGTCGDNITINPAPQVVHTYANLTSTSNSSVTPTPTPAMVALTPVTPTVAPTEALAPIPATSETGQGSSSFIWVMASIAIIVIGGIIYLVSRRKNVPPPLPPVQAPPPPPQP